jgi:hypothetical protein
MTETLCTKTQASEQQQLNGRTCCHSEGTHFFYLSHYLVSFAVRFNFTNKEIVEAERKYAPIDINGSRAGRAMRNNLIIKSDISLFHSNFFFFFVLRA